MAEEVRVWAVSKNDDKLTEVRQAKLDLEERIEKWIADDITVLDPNLLAIGKQVETEFGKFIDLLCIDSTGNLVIVELKRDKTPREVTAQALDYASWVKDLGAEEIREIADKYLKEKDLESAFKEKFDADLPEVINEHHAMRIVASEIDDSTERIIRYLSDTYGVDINAVTFRFFQGPDDRQLLVRTFTVAPDIIETGSRRNKRTVPTAEQMEQLASKAGVGDLYRQCRQALAAYLTPSTTKTTLAFSARFPDGHRLVVFSLVPGESSKESGLCYTVYSKRLADFVGVSEDQVASHLPLNPKPFNPFPASPGYAGLKGYINSQDQIQGIADFVKHGRGEAPATQ